MSGAASGTQPRENSASNGSDPRRARAWKIADLFGTDQRWRHPRWAQANGVPVIHFAKGENKEAIARPLIDRAAAEGGGGRVALVGVAQEKASVWRSWKAKGQEHAAHPHMEWGRQMAFVNHFYFYLWDPDWGPAFWKTNAYAPYPVWLWLNGHEWAKRQLDRAGVGYEALDNGFRSCEDPAALQRVCDRLGSGQVRRFFRRCQRRLPSPFTREDLHAAAPTTWRFASSRCPAPGCLTVPPPVGRSSRG